MKSFIKCHFLDSGAFSLRRDVAAYRRAQAGSSVADYYHSPGFRQYIDGYARFIKYYRRAVDYYANLDVIGYPELSWRNLRYLEEYHGLHPVPVIHARTDLRWLDRHLRRGYEFLAVGGLVGTSRHPEVIRWLDEFFHVVCPPPSGLPRVRLHAFGMTSGPLLFRYPFWSGDATNIGKLAMFGKIIVPYPHGDDYDYSRESRIIALSPRVRSHKFNINYPSIRPHKQRWVRNWLDHINNSHFFNRPLQYGEAVNDDCLAANYFFYHHLCQHLPLWPYPFTAAARAPSLFDVPGSCQDRTLAPDRFHVFLSGSDMGRRARLVLAPLGIDGVERMMTYYDCFTRKDGIDPELWEMYQERGGRRPRYTMPARPRNSTPKPKRDPRLDRWGKPCPIRRVCLWREPS